MTDAALSVLILLVTLALFVSEKVRHDLVALASLFACLVIGLVTPSDALQGFADPAVIAVAAVLVVGRAVEFTGIAAAMTRWMVPARAPFAVQIGAIMTVGALLSAFMNNIAALVITMPLATQITRRANLPAGAVLMPLSFATILGGMTTLIGTPANLILSSVREEQLGAPFQFFAMTGVGTAVAGAGLLYLTLIGWRLIPLRKTQERAAQPWRVFELYWPGGRKRPTELPSRLRTAGARLLALFRDGQEIRFNEDMALKQGDRFLLLSRSNQRDVAERTGLQPTAELKGGPDTVTARVVVAHGSFLIGHGYEAVRNLSGGEIMVVAGGPRPARLRQPLDTIFIESGDQLYIRGNSSAIARFLPRARLLEIDRFDPAPLDPRKGTLTILIFIAAIASAVFGLTSPAIAFLGAAGAVAALRLLPPEEIYRSIDWTVIVLLAAMIPVGQSFETSGAADIAASAMAGYMQGLPDFVILATLCAATLLVSIFLNNVATAVIMGPVAIEVSRLVDISPDAALLAVLIGASSDFLTPIGHQNNLLVMAPGGYRFTDYIRVGAVLAVLTVTTAAAVLSSQ